ncbi:MAG: hypothetical protein IJ422_01130 [Oscillospiraceae bacterium]|nr:hypothetical protein [Oscillospiraceae bacterium]
MTRKKAKRILRWYHFFRFLTILAMIICVIVSVGGYFLTQEAYEMYISLSPATSIEERISSYQQAIGLRPDRLEAYILLLNAYGEDGSFSKTESEAFLTIYNRNHTKFNAADSNYGVLHQKAGILYVTGYEDKSSVTRLRLALPFLEIASAGITEANAQALTVRCYCQIGRYYREYVWSAGAGMKEVNLLLWAAAYSSEQLMFLHGNL